MSPYSPPPNLLRPLMSQWKWWNLGGRDHSFRQGQVHGTAKLVPWTMTQDAADVEFLRAQMNPKTGGRWVPAGRYVMLKLLADTPDLNEATPDGEPDPYFKTVMSDTPDEMNDHADVLLNASGRVLVHGLGLGCVLSCLIANPKVEHVDVVEVNTDVFGLITPRFECRKVTFHLGSCVDIDWPRGTHWNYVWHDIWSSIDEDNLVDDERAEHGISYARLNRMFARRCDRQGSWALREARWQRDAERRTDRIAAHWVFEWNRAKPEDRLTMMLALQAQEIPVEQWRAFLHDQFPEQLRKCVERSKSKFTVEEARIFFLDAGRSIMPRRKARADARLEAVQ